MRRRCGLRRGVGWVSYMVVVGRRLMRLWLAGSCWSSVALWVMAWSPLPMRMKRVRRRLLLPSRRLGERGASAREAGARKRAQKAKRESAKRSEGGCRRAQLPERRARQVEPPPPPKRNEHPNPPAPSARPRFDFGGSRDEMPRACLCAKPRKPKSREGQATAFVQRRFIRSRHQLCVAPPRALSQLRPPRHDVGIRQTPRWL